MPSVTRIMTRNVGSSTISSAQNDKADHVPTWGTNTNYAVALSVVLVMTRT